MLFYPFWRDKIKSTHLLTFFSVNTQLPTDHNIIDKIKSGDHSAFKELFDTYKAMVFSICYKMSHNKTKADDLTQDVFLKIYSSIHTFRSDSKLSTWIYRISMNTCLNHQRRMKRQRIISLDFLFEENPERKFQLPDEDKKVSREIESREQTKILHRAIDTLSKNQKRALILRHFEGLSYKEISEILNTTVPSVESLLHRAKRNLSKKLIHLLK